MGPDPKVSPDSQATASHCRVVIAAHRIRLGSAQRGLCAETADHE